MLAEVRCISRACDLDLLLFFARHPCALLAAEQIFARLGYDFQQAAVSLEELVEAGVVKRSRGRNGAVCLYSLQGDGLEGAALRSLLRLAATPSGRRNMMRLLESRLGSGNVAVLTPSAAPYSAAGTQLHAAAARVPGSGITRQRMTGQTHDRQEKGNGRHP